MTATPWVDGPHRFNICYAVHGLQETRDCTKTTFNPHNFLCFHLKFIRIGVCCIFNVFVLNSVCTFKRIIHFYSPFFLLECQIVFSFWKNKHKSLFWSWNWKPWNLWAKTSVSIEVPILFFWVWPAKWQPNLNRCTPCFLVAPISLFLNCWLKSVKKISKSLL